MRDVSKRAPVTGSRGSDISASVFSKVSEMTHALHREGGEGDLASSSRRSFESAATRSRTIASFFRHSRDQARDVRKFAGGNSEELAAARATASASFLNRRAESPRFCIQLPPEVMPEV